MLVWPMRVAAWASRTKRSRVASFLTWIGSSTLHRDGPARLEIFGEVDARHRALADEPAHLVGAAADDAFLPRRLGRKRPDRELGVQPLAVGGAVQVTRVVPTVAPRAEHARGEPLANPASERKREGSAFARAQDRRGYFLFGCGVIRR